jgi:predicted transglutaminase-like cysteine proteinase
MNDHFKYYSDSIWHYNQSVYEYLKGDCEDIASTMAQHMINEGIGKEYLYLVYRKTSETTAHMFLAVDTSDKGLLHLDYDNSGYPIEDEINFHLALDNVGVYSWVKGNIR